jgi:hypothetical protein
MGHETAVFLLNENTAENYEQPLVAPHVEQT